MKRTFVILIALIFLLSAAGCAGDKPGAGKEGEDIVYVVDLCFVDKEYAMTGKEDPAAIRYYQNQHIFAKEGKQYFTLLDEVLRGNPFGSDSITTMITDKIKFNSVVVKDQTAYVDLAGENLSGGSFEESLLISQIVNSLIGSFDEIKRVQFLVDGEIRESLMGHYDAQEPFEEGIIPSGL